ncbi:MULTISPECIES: FAD-binding oxidoreductase [Pseudanabaena]|uniref:FAD linked oxidase domain protein n=2 Tax=Pseudanabaena TaxID=1152 RepID=L8N4D3_9CYAN|nr:MULTISPECIES: FAD-binding oxidoreductase [Pseudanabaena]ELS34531.1 FAD linked oxidase domain protein [Pseudanabaena biceps PCC 7429]MDG3493301.1 FAD-binding oxidoreductase [Pseudanabaena catenata USMAC16]
MQISLENLLEELSGIEVITNPEQVAKLSEDFAHFSPVLVPLLTGKVGDAVVRPTNENEVLRIAKACVKYNIPLTVRGSGTGNYGQCTPLKGGIILETLRMQEIKWIKAGLACVETGVKMAVLDKKAQEIGWESRMIPSTFRSATVGGFIAGGSGGIGSVLYGQLRDRGNLRAVRVVTLEDEPRIIELRGDDVQKVAHAYGTNGIITELEVPLAPAYGWDEFVVSFPDFMTAARFGQALGNSDGIIKKMISVHTAPIANYFNALQSYIPKDSHCALVLVAESDREPFQSLVRDFKGEICYEKSARDAGKGISLIEFSWNHTTLHARAADSSLTYLQSLFLNDPQLELVQRMHEYFGDEVLMHLEFIKVNGVVIPAAIQVVRFTTSDRLNEIIRYHEAQGVFIANPHTYILEDGGMKTVDYEQLNFKRMVDPYGLMNPDKMKAWQ